MKSNQLKAIVELIIRQVDDFVSKGNLCNVCYRTSMLKRATEFQMSKCFKMPESQTTKVVISMSDLRACLRGRWREVIEKHEIANIMKDPRDQHVLFRARTYVGFICKKTLNECIARENEDSDVKKSDLRSLNLCMECKCPGGIRRPAEKCSRQEMTNEFTNEFRPCKESSEECRCRRGFTECELKATESRGSCRICINKAMRHLQKSKCIPDTVRVTDHNESEFGPVSDSGSVSKDSILFSPTDGDNFEFGPVSDSEIDSIMFSPTAGDSFEFDPNTVTVEKPNFGQVIFPGGGSTVDFVPSDKEASTKISNDTITNQEDDSGNEEDDGNGDSDEIVRKVENKKASMNLPLVAGSGGLLIIVIITSLIVLKRRRRNTSDNVQRRENSWYFDIVPSRNKKGDSTHSNVTRTVVD